MGNRDYDNLISLLDHKNAEIEQLNVEILAYSARTSNLQTRLLQTFDALDETQRNHARELEEIEGKYTRLERRFRRHAVALNASEAERTELRESVLELVEKVEQSNDIRSWPVNRLQLTRFTEYSHQPKSTVQQPIDEKLAYAGAIIDQLRQERDNEREAHIHMCEALESKIDSLATQLARRDTELEYYATHLTHIPTSLPGRDNDTVSTSSSGYRRMDSGNSRRTSSSPQTSRAGEQATFVVKPTPAPGLTNEEIIKMLNATAARNRSLEVEIKTLFKQLEQARSRSSSSAPTPTSKAWPLPPNSQPVSELGNAPTATARYNIVVDGIRDNRNQDAFDESDGYGNGDRVGDTQRHSSRNQSSRDKGSSGTKSQARTVTPSSQISYGVSRPNRSNTGVRNVRKGRADRDVHEDSEAFNRDLHQNLGSPIRGKQPTPVSEDCTDDDNYVHHDNDDGLKMRARAGGASPPLAWDDTGYGFVDKEGGGVNDGDLRASTSAVGDSVVKPKSATIAGLDAQIQDLAAQIDSFRRERETLLKFVASQKQHRHRQWDKEEAPGATLSPGSSAVSRPGDDRSDGRYPAVAVEEMEGAVVKHGDDRDRDSPMEVARKDALDMFAHRLSVVEDDCLLLRHELGEYRLVAETRENELLDEIRLLQRRVEELDMRFHAQPGHPHESSTIEVPFSSHDYRLNASQPDGGHEQEDFHHQQQPQAGSFSVFDPTPALVPDTTVEDNDPYTTTPNITELPTTESHQTPSQVVTVQPSPSHTQFPWLQLNDSELDGLLDAIDGEASMELATPLMPTSFLDRDGEETQARLGFDREHQCRDQEGDRDRDHSEELMIWNESDERLSDGTGSGTRSRQEGENDGGAASVGGSRSRSGSPSESVVFSDDMGLRERQEVQYSPPDDGGKRGWVMGGDGSACDDLPEAFPRAQLEQEVTGEEQWSDDDYGAHHDGPHRTHKREDPHSSHPPQQGQGEEQETGPTRSLTPKTRFEGLGLVFTFPHRPETPSPTDSRSPPRSRSASASPTASTEQLRLELERAERELTVAQEMLEQGEDALRDVEATIKMGSFPSPSSEGRCAS